MPACTKTSSSGTFLLNTFIYLPNFSVFCEAVNPTTKILLQHLTVVILRRENLTIETHMTFERNNPKSAGLFFIRELTFKDSLL